MNIKKKKINAPLPPPQKKNQQNKLTRDINNNNNNNRRRRRLKRWRCQQRPWRRQEQHREIELREAERVGTKGEEKGEKEGRGGGGGGGGAINKSRGFEIGAKFPDGRLWRHISKRFKMETDGIDGRMSGNRITN